jgi:hypothetical protein
MNSAQQKTLISAEDLVVHSQTSIILSKFHTTDTSIPVDSINWYHQLNKNQYQK